MKNNTSPFALVLIACALSYALIGCARLFVALGRLPGVTL